MMRSMFSATVPLLPLLSWLAVPRLPRSDLSATHVHRDSWDKEYDYIIVGGGSAGSVLANRLSEVPAVRVLLLEAGGSENAISDIPLAYQSLQQTPMDWAYVTVPQKASCFGLRGKVSASWWSGGEQWWLRVWVVGTYQVATMISECSVP